VIIFESPPLLFMVPRGGHIKMGETLTLEVTPALAQAQLKKLMNEIQLSED